MGREGARPERRAETIATAQNGARGETSARLKGEWHEGGKRVFFLSAKKTDEYTLNEGESVY